MKNGKFLMDSKNPLMYTVAGLGIIFMVLKLGEYFFIPIFSRFVSVDEAYEMSAITKMMGTIQNFLYIGFNVIVGFILFLKARKINQMGVLWMALGFFFGINAVILFVLFSISTDEAKGGNNILDN
jgi:hypothetical protein